MNKQDWTYKKLGEVCESELGKTLNSTKDTGKLYPYLCAVNVLWDRIDTSSLKETRFEETELERYSVKKGDLLICEGGDIGRAAIWNKEQPIQYQNALHRVRFNHEVVPRFCLMYLRCLKKKGILDGRYGKGVTIKHLVKSSLLSIPIPVPPIEEQERIVAELDLLQGIIEKKKEQIKAYDQLAQSIFYSMFGDPIDNPKGWETKTIGDTCTITCGQDYKTVEDENGKYPIYGTGGIMGWANQFRCPKDSVIIGRKGNINNPILVDVDFWNVDTAFGVTPNNDVLSAIYFFFFCKEYDFTQHDVSVTIPSLRRTDILKIKLPVPPLSLQEEFAEKVEAIERQKALVQQSIEETQTMFDYTMDKYFG